MRRKGVKSSGKIWDDVEFGNLLYLVNVERCTMDEAIRKLNKIHGNSRNKKSVWMRMRRMRNGDIEHVDPIKPISPKPISRGETERMDIRIYELRQAGNSGHETARIINSEFGKQYSSQNIHSRYSAMRLDSDKRPESLKNADFTPLKERKQGKLEAAAATPNIETGLVKEYDLDMVAQLNRFDSEELKSVFAQREKLIYRLMSSQAIALRNYDSLNQFRGMTIEDLLKKTKEERSRVASLVDSEEEVKPIEEVHLIAVPGYGSARDALQVIFPVYHGETTTTERTLRSTIHDLSLMVLTDRKSSLKKSNNHESRFKDLTAYNLVMTGNPDYNGMSELITDLVDSDYKGIKVNIIEDVPFLGKIDGSE